MCNVRPEDKISAAELRTRPIDCLTTEDYIRLVIWKEWEKMIG